MVLAVGGLLSTAVARLDGQAFAQQQAAPGAAMQAAVQPEDGLAPKAGQAVIAPDADLSPVEPPIPAGKPAPAKAKPPASHDTICGLIEKAAVEHRLPIEFFTRLIWKESAFRPNATSHVGAQGIAQFMPGTAAERGLQDPYDVHQAILASAHLLRDLRARFGNLGLAAAAYNAGPRRVDDWLAGAGGLPYETRDYVAAITGRAAEDWADADRSDRALPDRYGSLDVKAMAMERPAAKPQASCLAIAKNLGRAKPAPTTLVGVTQRRAPWGVQVAAHFSQARALAKYGQLQRRYSKVLGGIQPMVVRELNRSRGRRAMFHVRLPADSRAQADQLCATFRTAGGACVVMRN
ncbi:lytic transglycosylase domain-containing protein [Rhodoligotrophos defluvii]|uniref:lytic transglycosylase domain-containing protein n=1 Tax=Rhodoligotrophos defluvii TaxID=2561934 RepID=UPI001484F24F|nr:lytic transglycosylase domain-containing protein [Rhodoligotrophos defluvii]